jgi:Relaxase/Mobilisation nuclease domain
MIVGFSKYSKGPGSGPVDYLTRAEHADGTLRTPPPKVLQGDPTLISRLIDALPFKHRYSSGVLSFAESPEAITPEMEEAIMDEFEQTAFAGLARDRYSILWVRHAHAGHAELHFVTARCELATGKSMNISPPGRASRELFDTFRSKINAEYGLADPTDVRRARDVSLPNHIAKLKADGARKGKKLQDDIREVISESVRREVAAGRITDRNGVVGFLESQGLIINRQGENYISVKDSPEGTKIRLRGVFFSQDRFDAVRASNGEMEAIHDAIDPVKAERLKERLEPMIAARAEYNRRRYGITEPAEPRENESLREYLRRNLGSDALRPRRWQGYGYERGLVR